MKNPTDSNGKRTRDLPACGAMSQPYAAPRAPVADIKLKESNAASLKFHFPLRLSITRQDDWKRIHNEELHNLHCISGILMTISSRKCRQRSAGNILGTRNVKMEVSGCGRYSAEPQRRPVSDTFNNVTHFPLRRRRMIHVQLTGC